jgi:hypothetical protein
MPTIYNSERTLLGASALRHALLALAGVSLMTACSASDSPGDSATGGNGGNAGATAGASGKGGGNATGGAAGSAGSGGAAGSPSTGGGAGVSNGGASGTGGGAGAGSAFVSDDFEAGTTLDPATWSVFASNASGDSASTVAVTTEVAHSGTHSVKVNVLTGGAMLMTKLGLPPAGGAVYYRAWARFAIGASSTTTWEPHTTFIESGGLDASGQVDQGDEVRLGGMHSVLAANLSQGDGLSPNPWSVPCPLCTAPPAADTWVCIEGVFDVANQKVQAWLDGKEIVNAAMASDWHSNSTYPQALERIGFGWEAYGSVPNTVYYDDVAVGYERIGCD